MANVPEDLHYSKDHEWVRVEGDQAIIGITDYAQHALGDVVYIDMPRAGDKFSTHEAFGSVESVKAVSEIFMPIAGEIIEQHLLAAIFNGQAELFRFDRVFLRFELRLERGQKYECTSVLCR